MCLSELKPSAVRGIIPMHHFSDLSGFYIVVLIMISEHLPTMLSAMEVKYTEYLFAQPLSQEKKGAYSWVCCICWGFSFVLNVKQPLNFE